MKVEGVRDDGALLITDGPAAAIVSDDGVWVTLRSSALARGEWTADSRALPDSLPSDMGKRLAAKRAEFEANGPENPGPPARSAQLDDDELRLRGVLTDRAAGHDVTPGHDELHHYWTRDPRGLAKWAKSPHPWTALYHHLLKFVGPERAKRMAAEWHHEVFGIWPGEKKGKNPLGPG